MNGAWYKQVRLWLLSDMRFASSDVSLDGNLRLRRVAKRLISIVQDLLSGKPDGVSRTHWKDE